MVNNKSSIINDSDPTHFEFLYPPTSRFEEIEKILAYVKEGNSVQLIGFPGVGRSTVLGLLSYNKNIRAKHLGENAKWFHFVPLNFSEIRKKPLPDAWKFIFLTLSDSLKDRRDTPLGRVAAGGKEFGQVVSDIFKEASLSNDELVLFSGLKKAIDFLCIEKELTIVFLFDRFEEYLTEVDKSFFANLRILRNRAKYRFSVVFSLPRPLEEIIDAATISDFHEFVVGHEVYLKLKDEEGLNFRISYLEKVSGKKIDEKIKNQILNLTGGHGKLTRLACEASLTIDKEQLTIDQLQEFLLEQKTVQGGLFEIWNFLTPWEQKSLETIPLVASSYLTEIGLVKDNKIAIPLFAEFAKTIQQSSNLTISYNPSTNEIKKGEATISDQLSSSEFKLLRFLVENAGRIVEKEEIINAVWKDSKTQEGVTDQALDQIVYRLRKKIEEDPNNPQHIQTIKGRGIKFSE